MADHQHRAETAGDVVQLLQASGYRIGTADDGNLIDDVFARNVRIGHLRIHLRQIQHIGDFEHTAKVHQRVGEGAAEGVLASLGIGLADVDAA